MIAHIAGVPVEESLPALVGLGTMLAVARGSLMLRLRHRRGRGRGRRK